MKYFLLGGLCFVLAQTLAWFQTNGLLISEWIANHLVLVCVVSGPIIGYLFAIGTQFVYGYTEAIFAARFLGFASGYMVFIPLAWIFFGESPFTFKNILSFGLCCALIGIQLLMANDSA